MSYSWFTGKCKNCNFEVVVSQSDRADYLWYCSNKKCYHHKGTHLFDTEGFPVWVRYKDAPQDTVEQNGHIAQQAAGMPLETAPDPL